MDNPYIVPPFNANPQPRAKVYFWWSWHPNYPYWSKSCWGGTSIQQAMDILKTPQASGMKYYHNKLIREHEDGRLEEVSDLPCPCLDVWREIARDPHKWRRPTDAQPVKGWNKRKKITCGLNGNTWTTVGATGKK